MAIKLLYRHEEELWSQVYAAYISAAVPTALNILGKELHDCAGQAADMAVERMRERMTEDESGG